MHTLFYVAIAMIAGLLLTRVVKLIKLPNVTGYLIAGLLIGPYCFKLVTADARVLELFKTSMQKSSDLFLCPSHRSKNRNASLPSSTNSTRW